MEQVVSFIQLVDARRKQIGIRLVIWKEFKACVDTILKTTTMSMMPSTCFVCITTLLGNADSSVRKKESSQNMCAEIVQIVDSIEESNASLKLAALSTLEIMAQKFFAKHSVFSICLASVTKGISSDNLAVSFDCLKTTSALVNVLGPRALAELPCVMENVIKNLVKFL
ncbi:hypothetical protein DITRI_Ditri06bG0117100 [Diplodiscus trichospermus]